MCAYVYLCMYVQQHPLAQRQSIRLICVYYTHIGLRKRRKQPMFDCRCEERARRITLKVTMTICTHTQYTHTCACTIKEYWNNSKRNVVLLTSVCTLFIPPIGIILSVRQLFGSPPMSNIRYYDRIGRSVLRAGLVYFFPLFLEQYLNDISSQDLLLTHNSFGKL